VRAANCRPALKLVDEPEVIPLAPNTNILYYVAFVDFKEEST
jgi:hypothetical protein